jgi:MYXO-CTERM domain-containing protein
VLIAPAARGSAVLVIAAPETVPLTGTITRIGRQRVCTQFIRRAGSNELAVNPAVSEDLPEGTLIVFGPCGVRQEFVQESCAVTPSSGAPSWLWWTILAAAGLLRWKKTASSERRAASGRKTANGE